MPDPIRVSQMDFYPLSVERWADFETLFGRNGACAGCWCMFWRQTRKEFSQNAGDRNQAAMRALVAAGQTPGLIGYENNLPLAWVSLGPRESFRSLERSHTLKRLDTLPVWALVCFFIARSARGRGLMQVCILAAKEYACQQGAHLLEAYPLDVKAKRPSMDLYMGNLDAFLRAGFKVIETRGLHMLVRACLD